MTNVLKDFRFGVRLLLKRPGETAIAVVALGVGIGLTATMFSVVHGIYFRDLPFAAARQLIHFERNNLAAGIQRMPATFPDYLYWREEQSSFQDIAAWYGTSIVVSGMGGHAQHRNGAYISSNVFPL
ncbi:MAG: hypothetical protein GY835_09145, partial [bacterium]|nr:hypothetical protein [bacterium]